MVGDKVDLDASAHVFNRSPQASGSVPRTADTPQEGGQDPESRETFDSAQRRKETALANLRELEHRVKLGALVAVEEEERTWATVAQVIREGLLSLPELIAPELAALTDARQVKDRLDREFRKLLTNIPEKIRQTVEVKAA